MKKSIKIVSIFCIIALFLSGCDSFFNASAYVQASLDALYKGDFTHYKKTVNLPDDQIQKDYEDGYKAQSDVFAQHFGVKTLTDTVRPQVEELYKTLFANVSYEVGESTDDKDGFNVTVKIKPITLFKDDAGKIDQYVQQFNAQNLSGAYVNMSTEEFENTYVTGILNILNADLNSLHYGDEQTLTLNVYKEDKAYYIDENDLNTLQKAVIPYA